MKKLFTLFLFSLLTIGQTWAQNNDTFQFVDKDGNVVNTSVGKGTNTSDPALLRAAQEAAKKTKFSPRTDGKDGDQFGTITYKFILN